MIARIFLGLLGCTGALCSVAFGMAGEEFSLGLMGAASFLGFIGAFKREEAGDGR
ncbi:MAG: hypothetical protein AAFY58_07800 [Planctomycetota bacterium]